MGANTEEEGQPQESLRRFRPENGRQIHEEECKEALKDHGMIRNWRKIEVTINNAKRLLEVREEFDSFDMYMWRFVNSELIDNCLLSFADMPSRMERSEAMSRDLKRRGFKFVGSTICYSFMQAVGMVNDHLIHCFRYNDIKSIIEKKHKKISE